MENLGAMAYSRYTGFREITDRDVLELHCIYLFIKFASKTLIFSKDIERKPFFNYFFNIDKGP